ncbi:MAG: calcium/sodium antiporter [Porphyromonadaceae bacterium]|nr:calcium/sodium antiporter [Porphyromonadaceae bacterium]
MYLDISFIVLGFVLLIKGADWSVGGASGLAKKHNVPDLVIGLTIVAFGTSAPELVVNSVASLDKSSDIVFGNIIGSNIFNLFVILGIVAMVFPVSVQKSMIRKEIPFSLGITVLIIVLSNAVLGQKESTISRFDAAILFLLFIAFLVYTFRQAAANPGITELEAKPMTNLKIWSLIIIGLAILIVGGRLVVTGAVNVAQNLGVSQKIIGLTIVAAGTSLPELVTSIVAAAKKKSDIAIGNVIGSNIFNFLLILSISGFINPITYVTTFNREMLMLTGGTVLLVLFMFVGRKHRVDRWEGALLFGIFIAYTAYLIQSEL